MVPVVRATSGRWCGMSCSCVVDGTGGGMIQTPDDRQFQRSHAWNSGSFVYSSRRGSG